MKIKVELNEDLIKLVKSFEFTRLNNSHYGIDSYSLFGGTYLYEQMAYILGYNDKVIPETLELPTGPRYQQEYEDKMIEYDEYLLKNLVFIEEILHQYIDKGGVKPGVYSCLDNVRIWEYEPFKEDEKNNVNEALDQRIKEIHSKIKVDNSTLNVVPVINLSEETEEKQCWCKKVWKKIFG